MFQLVVLSFFFSLALLTFSYHWEKTITTADFYTVVGSTNAKILWDYLVVTVQEVCARRSVIVVIKKNESEHFIVDFSFLFDENVQLERQN